MAKKKRSSGGKAEASGSNYETRIPRSIGRLSASALSHHSLCWEVLITKEDAAWSHFGGIYLTCINRLARAVLYSVAVATDERAGAPSRHRRSSKHEKFQARRVEAYAHRLI